MKPRIIEIHEAVQGHNDQIAALNRARFDAAGVFAINVMSAPGSGKTEFLARTLTDAAEWGLSPYTATDLPLSPSLSPFQENARCEIPYPMRLSHPTLYGDGRPNILHHGDKLRMAAIVGDIATDNDARRLNLTGIEVVQITTGGYCHLDAGMVAEAIEGMDLQDLDMLLIENVGNMVCPATFDLGEHARIALMSVTEGEDKPLKYPTLFKRADIVVISKMDIAEVVGYQAEIALDNLRRVAPQARIFEVSARTGKGMTDWYDYLRSTVNRERPVETALSGHK
jgi:hydrogenase nickel incorporation protein HypB